MSRLALGAATTLVALAVLGPEPVVAAQDVHPRTYRIRMKTAQRANARAMVSLGNWCKKNGFPAESLEWQLRGLQSNPDDKKLRKKLGFVPDGEGWRWDAIKRAEASETLLEPATGDTDWFVYDKRVRSLRKRAVARFVTLGLEIEKHAAASDEKLRPEWDDAEQLVWSAALRFDPTDQKALAAADHPQLDGRYVHRDALEFLTARRDRIQRAARNWAAPVPVKVTGEDARPSGGIKWARAKGGGVTVDSTFGLYGAQTILEAGVRAGWEALDTLGVDRAHESRLNPDHFVATRNKAEMKVGLRHFSDWDVKKIEERTEEWASQWVGGSMVISRANDIDNALDVFMSNRVTSATFQVRKLLRKKTKLPRVDREKWLAEALKVDILMRLKGSLLSKFAEKGRYENESREFEEGDTWMAKAQRFHDVGLLPPLRNLITRDLNRLDSLHTSTGYAFVVFLCERDEGTAQLFLQIACHAGADAAMKATYSQTLEDIEPDFHRWLDIAR